MGIDPRSKPKARDARRALREVLRLGPEQASPLDVLEILLGYAITNREVTGLATDLLARFGSLDAILRQAPDALEAVPGIGASTAALLLAAGRAAHLVASERLQGSSSAKPALAPSRQLQLLEGSVPAIGKKPTSRQRRPGPASAMVDRSAPDQPGPTAPRRRGRPSKPIQRATKTPGLRAYTQDLVVHALSSLPQAADHPTLLAFRDHLRRSLPFNAEATRVRSSEYLLNRFFRGGGLPG